MLRALAIAVATISLASINAAAQDFSVYTRVFDLDSKDSNVPFLRTQTVSHAGKVYDAIPVAGEITVLERAHDRIWIVNPDKGCMVRVEFDELRHLLRMAEDRLIQRLQELESQSEVSHDVLEALRFQLRPSFQTEFDPAKNRLRMTSKYISYDVSVQPCDQTEAVKRYLNYADWASQLNYVLHPQPFFPTLRLELNEQLRRRNLLPTRVVLRAQLERPLNLMAEHVLTWSPDARSRQSIQHWESKLNDSKLQMVSLSEYQRIAFGQQTAKSR